MGRKSIAEIRKEEIIEAFFEVVSEHGFAKATIREIANAAGCNHGMLHHYFPNKEAIIQAAVAHIMNIYKAELLEGLSKHDSAAKQLRFIIPWFFDLNRFNLELSRAWVDFWALSKNEESVSAALKDCYKDVRGIFVEIINRGIRTGEFRKVNARVTANVMLAALEGSTMLWVVDTDETLVKSMGKIIEDMLSHYLIKEED